MARANKLERFAEMRKFPHVFEPYGQSLFTQDYEMRGGWNEKFFNNNHPIILELGCGKGEYTVEMAREFPNRNFIGIDIKGNRMWKGAKRSLADGLTNVAFLRIRIEFINRTFAPGEVDELWITFPDPQPKKSSKRLTSSNFLNSYQKILKPGGYVNLKTDSKLLFDYTMAVIEENGIEPVVATDDLYAESELEKILHIKTYYESGFLEEGKKITYIRFQLPEDKSLRETKKQFRS